MAAMIVELDDELLPPVSPKGFSSPSEQQHVSFSPEPTAKSPRSKSKHLGLSLRRITPDKKSQRALQASPSHGEQSNTNSLMSRLTGRSRNSLATSATPVMRGGRRGDSTASAAPSDLASGYVSSTGTSVTPTTVNTGRSSRMVSPLRGRNIEKMQKMEDEYYSPQAHWAEEEYEEEELDDGELPSLRRVSSAGSRGSLNRNWDNDRRNQSYRTSEGYEVQDGPSKAARAAAAAAAATLVTPTEGRRTTKEQLKVAGFWSQLDDDGGGGSDDDDRSDAPNDERQWRRSQSPPRDRGGARRVGWAEDVHNVHSNADESSIGLDLVPAKYDDDDATSAQKGKNGNSKETTAESPSNWNLLEKAACYANEDKAGYEDDEDSDLKSGSRLAKDKYDAMDETYETDDQSLDRKATKKETGPDDEEDGMLACLTTALTTMCGYEVASAVNNACGNDAPTSPTKKRAHEIIAKDSSRRRSGAAALVSDGESTSYDGSETMDAVFEGLEEEEDVAVELQYHNEAGIGSPATSPQAKKKKRGLRKLLHLPGRKKNKEPLRKTVVTTTTRSGKDRQEGHANSKLSDYMQSLTFEQEILGEDGEAVPPPPPTDGMGSPTSVEQLKEEGNDETTQAKTAAAGAAAVGAAALAVGAHGGDDDDAELESQAAAWSTIEKNTYLRQLAERAKMDYAAKGGDGKTANDGSGGAGLTAAAVGAAAVGAAALAASGTTDTNDTRETTGEGTVEESTIGSINRNGTADTGVPDALQSSYNADYNSFSPAEKRQFLRLLNSGMTPQAAAKNIAAERVESPAVIEEEGEYDDAEEDAHVTDGPREGPTERATAYPADEEMPSLMEPPGDVLSGASGESAELSTKEAHAQGASGSDQAQDGKGSRGKMAKLAAIATVPAMIAARKRSKDKSPKVYQGPEEGEKEEERPTTAAAYVGEEDEEEPAPAADGLISSGIGYYDGVDRGLDPSGQDNDDSYDDSGLLDASSVASPTSRRSRKKLLGAGAAAGLVAAKVASRKNRSSYKHVARDDNHVVSPGSPVNRGFDYGDGTKSDFTAKSSSRSLSSALKIVQRNKKAEKFSKLDADLALDQVQPSHTRSAEEEGTPSWLLPRDEEMEDGEDARDEEDEVQGLDRNDDAPEDMEEESVQEGEEEDSQAPSWSPALSPEMASAPPYASPRDVTSEAGDSNAVTPGQDNRAITSNAPLHRPSPAESQPSDEGGLGIISDDQSYATYGTYGTYATTASKSHRKRHKGAANKRLQEAREAESHAGPSNKGWLGSIRDAASEQGQVWDPERGWVDYAEPEVHHEDGHDYRSIGELHLPAKRGVASSVRASPEEEAEYINRPKPVGFPSNWEKEREKMIESPDGHVASALKRAVEADHDDVDDSVFDTTTVNTVNTAAESSVLTYSTATAPTHRSKPKHRPTDKRKVGAADDKSKPIGWKESMENATAHIDDGTGRRWDYKKGWVKADGSMDDDMSELTRTTLEQRSAGQEDSGEKGHAQVGHIGQFDVSPTEDTSYQLPSVLEEETADGEVAEGKGGGEKDENYVSAGSSEDYSDVYGATEDAPDAPEAAESNERGNVGLPPLAASESGSDKENEVQSAQKPPVPAKRSLNQWLEKTSSDAEPEYDESMDVVMSNKSKDTSSDSPFSPQISRSLDPFGNSDEGPRMQEVQVVKESISDSESDLFQPTAITDSFMKTVGGLIDSRDAPAAKESNDNAAWVLPQPAKEERSVLPERSDDGEGPTDQSVSSKAQAWTSSIEKRSQMTEGRESDASAIDSEAPQVNTAAAEPPQNLDPPTTGSYVAGTKNAKKASDSWIRSRQELEKVETNSQKSASWIRKDLEKNESSAHASNEVAQNQTSVGGLRAKFEKKDANPRVFVKEEDQSKPVFVQTNNAKENDVFFRSSAMGIRLKRGEDGFVRVVSVTEATAGSSIVRDGVIEPEDRIMEAAGVDLRKPITNSQWGETVTKIRNAPRPMKFVVACGPRRQEEAEVTPKASTQQGPAKFVMESRLSKSPEGQQVLETLTAAKSIESDEIRQAKSTASKSTDGAEETTYMASTVDDEDQQTGTTAPKESFFKRIASCAAPVSNCAVPGGKSNDQDQDDGTQVPMAHLQFLKTNPTIARVTNAASRRYPALCGRPDTIFEEPDDDKRGSRASRAREVASSARAYDMTRSRSGASYTTYDSHTAASQTTMSTYDKTLSTYNKTEYSGGGDNTAFLDQLANKTTSSKPSRPSRDNDAKMTLSEKLGKQTLAPYGSQEGSGELGWPTDDNDEPVHPKDTIDNVSTYSSHSSSYQNNGKKDTARQAELLAAAKVEDMMNKLADVDPDSQSEI